MGEGGEGGRWGEEITTKAQITNTHDGSTKQTWAKSWMSVHTVGRRTTTNAPIHSHMFLECSRKCTCDRQAKRIFCEICYLSFPPQDPVSPEVVGIFSQRHWSHMQLHSRTCPVVFSCSTWPLERHWLEFGRWLGHWLDQRVWLNTHNDLRGVLKASLIPLPDTNQMVGVTEIQLSKDRSPLK